MKPNNELLNETASVLKTIGHPVRLLILSLLSENKGRGISVKQIQEKLNATQPETSKHLIIMRNHEILKVEKRGGFSFYRISQDLPYLRAIIKFLNIPKL